jgi:hypothetical protein
VIVVVKTTNKPLQVRQFTTPEVYEPRYILTATHLIEHLNTSRRRTDKSLDSFWNNCLIPGTKTSKNEKTDTDEAANSIIKATKL